MGGSTTTTQKSTTAPAPEAMEYYKQLMQRLQDVGKLAYTPYEGQRVAGFTPYQQMAMQTVPGLQNVGAGTLQEALEAGRRGTAPVTTADIQRYQDPYQQMVVDAMSAKMRQQEAEDLSKLQGASISAGAYGGDRAQLAQAQMMRNQEQERNARIADLMSRGYTQSLGAAQADREAAARGAQNLSALATQQYTQPMSWVRDLYGMGAAEQALEQQKLNVPYQQYLEERAFPYEQTQYLAGLGTSLGSQMGGVSTGTTTQPKPSMLSQLGGLGLGLAFAPMTGGASLFGAAASNAFPGVFKPSATGGRIEKEDGGGLTKTAMFHEGYIPTLKPVRGQGAPGFSFPAPTEQKGGASDMIEQAMSLAKKFKGSNEPESVSPWQTIVTPSYEMSSVPGISTTTANVAPSAVTSPSEAFLTMPTNFANGGGTPSKFDVWSKMAQQMPESSEEPLPIESFLTTPTTEALADNLPQIEVPQSQETTKKPSSGINEPYGEGKEGATKGSSLLGSLLGLSPEAEQAGMMAGLAMATGQSSFPLTNIGAGGMSGMKYYNELMKAKQEQALKREEMQQKYSRANLIPTGLVTEDGKRHAFKDKNNPNILVDENNVPISAAEKLITQKEFDLGQKKQATYEQDKNRARSAYRQYMTGAERMKDDINEALIKIGPLSTGFFGKPLSQIPGQHALYVRKLLQSLTKSMGMQAIAQLKAMSKTGATGFGSLTEKEFDNIATTVAEVQNDLSVEDLQHNLAKLMKFINSSVQNYQADFLDQFKEEDLPKFGHSTETTESIVNSAKGQEPSFSHPKISTREEYEALKKEKGSGTPYLDARDNQIHTVE